jgi:hypothetical protein
MDPQLSYAHLSVSRTSQMAIKEQIIRERIIARIFFGRNLLIQCAPTLHVVEKRRAGAQSCARSDGYLEVDSFVERNEDRTAQVIN